MKKTKIILILLISIFTFNIKAYAASGSLSVSNGSVYVGDSFTVSVNINSAAAWNVHTTASGPVSGCIINQADATADAMDTNKTFTANCTATGEGTITISLSGDVTSASDGNAVLISGTKTVSVVAKPAPQPTPTPTPTPQPSAPTVNLSNNNNLKELSLEGHKLEKVDNNNYTLTVSNNVTSVNINATAEDAKANVSGTGSHELQVGENNIEVIVTAESGAQNKINIKVTRKDGYYLEDLDTVLKDNKTKDADIIISTDSKISKEQITKIKESKKTIRLNYYNENKKLIYSWSVNGNEIKEAKEFTTSIIYSSENVKEIYKLSNYADGIYVNFKHNGDLPKGTKIKLYIGDKFEDGNIVKVYHYNTSKKTLDFIEEDLKVTGGYIEFEIEHCSEYFVTMSQIGIKEESSINIFMILSIIELIIIIGLVAFGFMKLKSNKKGNENTVVEKLNNIENNNENDQSKDDVIPLNNNLNSNN